MLIILTLLTAASFRLKVKEHFQCRLKSVFESERSQVAGSAAQISSEAIQLLEEPHRPPPQQNQREENEDEDDNDGTLSGDGLLAGSPPEDLEMSPSNPPRSLTYVNGLAIVIGLQVGAGIFSTPAVVRTNVATTTAAVLV